MTPILVGAVVLAFSLALLAAVLWAAFLLGSGRHRASRWAAPRPPAAPVPLGPLLAEVDTADFDHCPAEQRTTPHFLHADGSRTCCACQTSTAGDQ